MKIVANVNANNENTKKAAKQNGQLVELELVLTKHEARRAPQRERKTRQKRKAGRAGERERERGGTITGKQVLRNFHRNVGKESIRPNKKKVNSRSGSTTE